MNAGTGSRKYTIRRSTVTRTHGPPTSSRPAARTSRLRLEVEKLLDYDARAQAFLERPLLSDLASDLANNIPPAPERIGPYQLGSRLGVGGMGEVYLATDSLLGRPVALKLIASGKGGSSGRPLAISPGGPVCRGIEPSQHRYRF